MDRGDVERFIDVTIYAFLPTFFAIGSPSCPLTVEMFPDSHFLATKKLQLTLSWTHHHLRFLRVVHVVPYLAEAQKEVLSGQRKEQNHIVEVDHCSYQNH